MKKTAAALIALLIALPGYGAQAAAADGTPMDAGHAAGGSPPASPGMLNGKIVETMDAAGYTYALIDTGSDKVWVAATETGVKVGERVSVPAGMLMTDFSSKSLNRTFDRIYFVSGIYPEGSPHKSAAYGQDMTAGSRTVVSDAHVEGVTRAPGGYTVEEVLARSSELNGKQVKVHGKVVKIAHGIMGTNWMHIQDGTPGDLAVTSDADVASGDLVTVEGVLSTNKDFGAGYVYPAIVEKATVTKQ